MNNISRAPFSYLLLLNRLLFWVYLLPSMTFSVFSYLSFRTWNEKQKQIYYLQMQNSRQTAGNLWNNNGIEQQKRNI